MMKRPVCCDFSTLNALSHLRRQQVRDAVLDGVTLIALSARQVAADHFVVHLFLGRQRQRALVHRAGEDVEQVFSHGASARLYEARESRSTKVTILPRRYLP